MSVKAVGGETRVEGTLSWLTLFASTGTLICCALPILLVSAGMGGAVAALTSSFPLLITLSQYKLWVFLGSGSMLALVGWMLRRPERACPQDLQRAAACAKAHQWNRRVYALALVIWGIGFVAACLAYPIAVWWDA